MEVCNAITPSAACMVTRPADSYRWQLWDRQREQRKQRHRDYFTCHCDDRCKRPGSIASHGEQLLPNVLDRIRLFYRVKYRHILHLGGCEYASEWTVPGRHNSGTGDTRA